MTESPGSIIFIPHGGGPLPLLGHPGHDRLNAFLRQAADQLIRPDAIVVISAHWEESSATVTAAAKPELIYDYYHFPPESYEITYPASGYPALAKRLAQIIAAGESQGMLDQDRGFDHGTFIPLKIMYPDADIPCIQVSLMSSLDPAAHIALGKSLASLGDDNILIIGSGMSYHKMQGFMKPTQADRVANLEFDQWLLDAMCNPGYSIEQREEYLLHWDQAPSARDCHPREEHLLPLHVCFGAAAALGMPAQKVFNDDVMGMRTTALLW